MKKLSGKIKRNKACHDLAWDYGIFGLVFQETPAELRIVLCRIFTMFIPFLEFLSHTTFG